MSTTTTPTPPYWTLSPISQYIRRLHPTTHSPQPQPAHQPVDHFWLNLLRHYFPLSAEFAITWDGPGYEVMNIRQDALHKLIFVEAMQFPPNVAPGWQDTHHWDCVLAGVGMRMRRAREIFGAVQTVYGIVAVGDRVRFYCMPVANNPDGGLMSFVGGVEGLVSSESRMLSIHGDREGVHRVLEAMSWEARSGDNDY
ncbi:hypothetical protein BO71DRAFT_439102 [Aspergillus ellipticus CBS 707.79]|uniref:Uncharacterized protein n=1 Tax=Aspergillus ellipticus CBS 707.79 TaxID=1448320 RepID=A0A319DHV0_9EURO|nr:hypothetical protein BO71DRAFT_439102 [Aspergillus ellipticus CBS 707.79]